MITDKTVTPKTNNKNARTTSSMGGATANTGNGQSKTKMATSKHGNFFIFVSIFFFVKVIKMTLSSFYIPP